MVPFRTKMQEKGYVNSYRICPRIRSNASRSVATLLLLLQKRRMPDINYPTPFFTPALGQYVHRFFRGLIKSHPEKLSGYV